MENATNFVIIKGFDMNRVLPFFYYWINTGWWFKCVSGRRKLCFHNRPERFLRSSDFTRSLNNQGNYLKRFYLLLQ
jgi:hypothetical protein